MAELKLIGAVGVKVRPDTSGFRSDTKRGVERELDGLDPKVKVGVEADLLGARRELLTLKQMADRAKTDISIGFDLGRGTATARFVEDLRSSLGGLNNQMNALRKQRLRFPGFNEDGLRKASRAADDLAEKAKSLIALNRQFKLEVKTDGFKDAQRVIDRLSGSQQRLGRISQIEGTKLHDQAQRLANQWRRVDDAQKGVVKNVLQSQDNLRIGRMHEQQLADMSKHLSSIGSQIERTAKQDFYSRMFGEPDRSIADLFANLSQADLEKAEQEAEQLKKSYESRLKGIKAQVEAQPTGLGLAAAQLRFTARPRTVNFFVRVNEKSLLVAEGLLKSLAGLNVLESTGRLLENIFTKFDTFTLKTGALSAGIGGVVDTLAYATTAALTIGEGIFRSVGLLATAPAFLSAIAATAVITTAAFDGFKDAIDGDAEALAALPPAARDAALALQGTWTAIQRPVQERFWDGMGDSLTTMVNKVIPRLSEGLAETAFHAGRFGAGVNVALEKIAENGVLDAMFRNLQGGFDEASGAAEPLVDAINTLGLRGSEYLPRFGRWLTDITTRFDDWIQKADEAGRITSWIEGGVQSLKDMYGVGESVVDIFRAMTRAASDGGAGGLGEFRQNLRGIADMMLAEPFQSRMARIFEGARDGASKLNMGVQDLGSAFGEAAEFTGDLLELLGDIGGVTLSGLSTVVRNLRFQDGVLDGFTGLRDLIVDLQPAARDLGDIIGNLGTIAGTAFEGLGPIFNTATGILGDTVTRLADDIERIVPKLSGFVTSVLEATAGPIELVARAAEGVLTVFEALPGPIGNAAIALGAFLLMKNQFAGFFRSLDGSRVFSNLRNEWVTQQALAGKTVDTMGRFSVVGATMDRVRGHVSGLNGLLRDVNGAARHGAGGLSGFHDRLGQGVGTIAGYSSAIGTSAKAGLRGALSGISGVLGGPWGIALAAGVTAMTLFGQAQADVKARVDALVDSLDKQTGAATAATLGQIAQEWTDLKDAGDNFDNLMRGVFGGAKAANETAQLLGLSLADITNAIAEGGPAYDELLGHLQAIADYKNAIERGNNSKYGGPVPGMDRLKAAAEGSAAALGTNLGAIKSINGADLDHIIGNVERTRGEAGLATSTFEGLDAATEKTTANAELMAGAMQRISDRTADAAGKIDAIRTSLDLLNGNALSKQEAEFAAASALDQAVARAEQLKEGIAQAGQALFDTQGLLSSTSAAGVELYETMKTASDAILIEAQAAYDAADLSGATPAEAAAAAQAVIDGNAGALAEIAAGAGLTVEQLQTQWDTFFGQDWTLTATFSGNAQKYQEAEKIARDLGMAFDGEEFTAFLNAQSDPAAVTTEQIRAHMTEVMGRNYVATLKALPGPALTAIQQVGDNAKLVTNADYIAELEALDKTYPGISAAVGSIARMTGGDYAAAIKAINATYPGLAAAGFDLNNLPDELVSIFSQWAAVPPAPAIPPLIARIQPVYDRPGSALGFPAAANGAIWDGKSSPYAGRFGMQPHTVRAFADGGIEQPGSAKIYSASSTYRIFAEPETGGEAYIPLSAAKRDRSVDIWRETGRLLGQDVEQYADGGISGAPSTGPTFNITNHYPVSEPTSTTVNKALAIAGYPDLE
ncbi:hypothetical protein GCM10027403_14520 [Arthrobacter tecti]